MFLSKAKNAFTLTEVGIAVVVIGIIVAITVPAIVNRFQNASMAVMLKKNYVELEEKLTEIQTHRYYKGNLHNSILMSNNGKFFTNNFTYSENCQKTPQPCFAASYKSLSGTSQNFEACKNVGYSVLLKSGSAICLVPPADTAIDSPATIYIDVNGEDLPNIGGRDMYTLQITHDFSIKNIINKDDEDDERSDSQLALDTCTESPFGFGCLNVLMDNDWKMDY